VISKVYAVISTAQLARAHAWYAQLFGRRSDLHPMAEVHEWYFANGGVQLVADAERAGRSMLTLIVSDLEAARAELQTRHLSLGPATASDFAIVAQIRDPDGNQLTFAEPGPAQTHARSQMQTAHPGR
jgi:predicted enzyme related to lactoylglutathione lyase